MRNPELLLLVDDDVNNLKILSSLLKREYRIKVARGGREALRLAEEDPIPDLILLDVMMPEMDGYTVCERLKSNSRTQDIPVIFLTGKTQAEDETRGFQAGAVDYVTKPINPPVLWARVKAQLALAAQLRHAREELNEADNRIASVTDERDRIEIRRRRLHEQQQALLAVARAALLDLSLKEYLRITLEVLKAVPWLKVEARGALLLANRKGELIMVAQQGLGEAQRAACAKVLAGSCICGRACVAMKPLFLSQLSDCPDSRLRSDADGAGCHVLPLIEGNRIYGVLTILLPPGTQPLEETSQFMADMADIFTNLIRRRQMEEAMRISRLEVQVVHNEIIQKLSVAVESRDTETGLHVLRMSQYARATAQAMGCDEATCALIELAAPMHDVGKIGIEDRILRKPGKLTDDEFAAMKEHPVIGGRILEGDDPLIRMGREIALSHHERWDGRGYPNGLSGEDIPFSGRVCAVADVFDALTTKRPYKEAWSVEKAVELIAEGAGKAFDPKVVAAFREALPEVLAIKARYQDDAVNPGDVLVTPTSRVGGEVWLPWQDSYSVGIDIIDEHHRYLLDWTNRVYQAVREGAGTVEIAKALFALEQYARIHFRTEERLMATHDYAGLEQHRLQHRSFEAELRELREEIGHNPFIVGMGMMEYLRNWLFSHILDTDKQTFAVLANPA
ncbi:MAG: bacteriohemerythrin [Candidatus Contendobacter sp.]|nr:bacteriohemerythrin [Candidatus Contendobacter sp.]MDS4057676.1 bacteriohemerythrin [Candidatus Contendobacter sp.]